MIVAVVDWWKWPTDPDRWSEYGAEWWKCMGGGLDFRLAIACVAGLGKVPVHSIVSRARARGAGSHTGPTVPLIVMVRVCAVRLGEIVL